MTVRTMPVPVMVTSSPDRPKSLLAHFRAAHDTLAAERDLSPRNPKINTCLTDFVRAVLDARDSHDVLDDPDVRVKRPALLQFLARAEYEMEKFHAVRLCRKNVLTESDLATFQYRDNYKDLVDEEVFAARAGGVMPDDKPLVFVGSGPLPLTAIDMHRKTGLPVVCVDNDDAAVSLSQRMIAALGLSSSIRVVKADGRDFNYAGAGMVMVAALVDQRDDVLARIRATAPDSTLAIRSAEGARSLLYRAVDPNDVRRSGYVYAGKSRATSSIINTTLFFR